MKKKMDGKNLPLLKNNAPSTKIKRVIIKKKSESA